MWLSDITYSDSNHFRLWSHFLCFLIVCSDLHLGKIYFLLMYTIWLLCKMWLYPQSSTTKGVHCITYHREYMRIFIKKSPEWEGGKHTNIFQGVWDECHLCIKICYIFLDSYNMPKYMYLYLYTRQFYQNLYPRSSGYVLLDYIE